MAQCGPRFARRSPASCIGIEPVAVATCARKPLRRCGLARGGQGAAIDVPPARLSAGGTWHVLVQAYAAEAAEV